MNIVYKEYDYPIKYDHVYQLEEKDKCEENDSSNMNLSDNANYVLTSIFKSRGFYLKNFRDYSLLQFNISNHELLSCHDKYCELFKYDKNVNAYIRVIIV